MDVRLPDGTVISNVPEGTTKAELTRKFKLMVGASPQQPASGPQQILQAPAQPFQLDPNEALSGGMNPNLEAALIAAGETASRGINKVQTSGFPEEVQQLLPNEAGITDTLRDEFPISTFAGDTLPALAVPGSGVASGIAAGAGIGFATGDDNSDVLAGMFGGGMGSLLARGLALGISPFSSNNPLSKRNKLLAKKLGVFDLLDLGQVTGSNTARNMAASLRSSQTLGAKITRNAVKREEIINDKILRGIGQRGKAITAEKLEAARKAIGSRFERVAKNVKNLNKGQAFFSARLDDLEDSAQLELGEEGFAILKRNIERARNAVSGRANGSRLMAQRSEVANRAARANANQSSVGPLGDKLAEISDALDELLEFNAPKGSRKILTEARKQWASLSNLRDRNVVSDESVNPKALQGVLKRKRPDDYNLGGQKDNPQFQLARLAEGLADDFGRPGTAEASGFGLGNITGEQTFGRIANELAPAQSNPALRVFLRNQLTGQKTRDLSSLFGARAGATAGPQAEELFQSLRN